VLPTTYDGFSIIGLDAAVLTYTPSTFTLQVDDPDGLLRTSDISATHTSSNGVDTVDWSFAVNDGLSTPYLKMSVSTTGMATTVYTTSTITSIDNQMTIEVIDLTSTSSSQGDASVDENEIYPGDALMVATVDQTFTNSGARLLNGFIEARMNVDVEATDALGGGSYTNPGTWTSLNVGSTNQVEFSVPNGTSGQARIWLEARTSEDLDLQTMPLN
jgi:hypothetical protein